VLFTSANKQDLHENFTLGNSKKNCFISFGKFSQNFHSLCNLTRKKLLALKKVGNAEADSKLFAILFFLLLHENFTEGHSRNSRRTYTFCLKKDAS